MQHKDMHTFEGLAYEVGDSVVITIPAENRSYFGIKKGSTLRLKIIAIR